MIFNEVNLVIQSKQGCGSGSYMLYEADIEPIWMNLKYFVQPNVSKLKMIDCSDVIDRRVLDSIKAFHLDTFNGTSNEYACSAIYLC